MRFNLTKHNKINNKRRKKKNIITPVEAFPNRTTIKKPTNTRNTREHEKFFFPKNKVSQAGTTTKGTKHHLEKQEIHQIKR